ncbi:hypothetical protein, partial [Bartonella bacilliformis]|uniref:hypothetical protein n=1 Tax=Bartonella bacilliformis TaxID=774 RepID=UPI0039E55DA5
MSEKLHNIINVCVGRLLFIFLGIVIYLQNLFGIITQTQWNVYAASSSSQLSQSCLYSSGVRHQDINYSACGYKDPVNFIQDHKIDKSKFSHQGKDGGFVGKKIAIVAEMSGKMGMKNVIINGEGVARSLALYAKDRGVIEGDNVNISDVIDAIYASEGTTVALKGSTLKAKARIVHAGKGARVSLDGFGQMRGVKGIVIEGAKVQVSNSSFLGTEFGINVDHKDQERGDLRLTKVNIGRESTEEEKKTGNITVDKPKVGIQVKNNSVAEVKEGKIIANATGLEVDNGGDVRLSDTNIIAKQGMRVRSNKSKVTMDSGSITSLNDDTILILGASVSLFGVKLENIAKKQVIHIRDGGTLYMEGGSIVAEEGRAVQVGKGNMTLHNVNINSKDSAGIWAEQGKVSITEGVIDASKVAVKVDQKGDERTSILLNKVTVKSKGMGGEQALYAIKGTIEMIEGQIKAQGVAVQASNGTIKLSDGVAVNSGGSHGLVVEGKEATIEMTKGSITAKETAVKASNGTIKLSDGVAVNSEGSYGLMVEGKEATIEMTKGSITAKETAVKASNGTIKLS